MSSANEPVLTGSHNPYLDLLAQTKVQRRLLTVHWELTHRCNERCAHCYLDVLEPHVRCGGELTTAESIAVLEQAAALGALYLTLSGGEALMRRDFFEIAAEAHARRFVLRIFTNGLAITPKIATRLADLHPYAVEISLYGADALTHDTVTGRPGSFVRTRRAFELLAAQGVRTVFKTPLMVQNVDQFDALRALAADLGATFRHDLTITPKRSGHATPINFALSYAGLIRHFRRTLPDAPSHSASRASGCRLCNVGHNALVIAPNGDVYPCLELRQVAGNVRRTPLRTIWEESPVWQPLTALHTEQMAICGQCPLGALCDRCHGLADREHGDLRGVSTVHCIQALARRQVLVERGAAPDDLPLTAHLSELQRSLGMPPVAERQQSREFQMK